MCRTENFYVLYMFAKRKTNCNERAVSLCSGHEMGPSRLRLLMLLCTICCRGLGVNSLLMYIQLQIIQNCVLETLNPMYVEGKTHFMTASMQANRLHAKKIPGLSRSCDVQADTGYVSNRWKSSCVLPVLKFGSILMGGGGEMMKENKLVLPPSKKEGYKNVVSGENRRILCAIYHCTRLELFHSSGPLANHWSWNPSRWGFPIIGLR